MLPALRFATAAVATSALVILPACTGKVDQKASTALVEKVNGTPITRDALDRAVKALVAANGAPKNLSPQDMQRATEAALNQLTSAELLYQAAQKLEIKDLDQQVAASVARNRAKYPSEIEFQEAIKAAGLTPQSLKDLARKDIVINNFIVQTFAPKVTVSEAEAKKFYDENKEKAFTKGERIKVSHILIGVPEKAAPEAKKQAREKAEALLKRVKAGEDFAALAKKESTSPTKVQGGDLGEVGKGQTLPPFEKAAFALKAGEISNVVETPVGYHIIKVTEKIQPSTEKFEKVSGKIAEYQKREKIRVMITAFVEDQRKKAKIEKM